jgi:glycosyltransferase involved in cell wall biosynthesis
MVKETEIQGPDEDKMRILAWPIRTTLNPYTGLVFSNLGSGMKIDGWPGNLLRKYDIWHAHWPDALLGIPNTVHATVKVAGMFATMDYLRSRGTKVIWTMHNFASHEARHPQLEAWFWRQFIPRVDGAISLSSAGLEMAHEQFPQLKNVATTVIPHGHYRKEYPQVHGNSRELLGIPQNAKVVMFFGAIRAYKNVDILIRAFRSVRGKDVVLYIVGNPNSTELAESIVKESAQDSRVVLKFGFAEANDVSKYLGAADVVVLPYREVLNSGSALLALSCNRPVMVPERGAMGELKAEFTEQWVRTFKGEIDGPTIESGLNWGQESGRPAICPISEKYEWERIGSETVQFYKRVVNGTSSKATKTNLGALDDGRTPL